MMVFRPVPGVARAFTIVGENLVTTKAGYLTVAVVAETERINVQPGDLVGWWVQDSDTNIMKQ